MITRFRGPNGDLECICFGGSGPAILRISGAGSDCYQKFFWNSSFRALFSVVPGLSGAPEQAWSCPLSQEETMPRAAIEPFNSGARLFG